MESLLEASLYNDRVSATEIICSSMMGEKDR
jgi:hypothetical protein